MLRAPCWFGAGSLLPLTRPVYYPWLPGARDFLTSAVFSSAFWTGSCLYPTRCFGRLGKALFMPRGSPYCVVFLLASFGIFLLWVGADPQDNYTAEESALAPSSQTVPTQSPPAVSCRSWYTPRRLHPERPSREHGTTSQEAGWQGEEAWQLRRPKKLSGIWPSSSRYDGTSRYYRAGHQRPLASSYRGFRRWVCRAAGTTQGQRSPSAYPGICVQRRS